jgi:hypothetical protein
MAYSYYILPELTEAQKVKFLSGINPEKSDGLDDAFFESFTKTIERTLHRRSVSGRARPLVTYQGSPGKKAPRFFGKASVPQDKLILEDLQLFNTTEGIMLYSRHKKLYEPLLRGALVRRQVLDVRKANVDQMIKRGLPVSNPTVKGGSIHFIQEPGGKLRSIASPFRIHQEALRPFGQSVYRLIQSLPWDCTFDQSKAHPYIQSCLGQGRQVHSIDLSSATDHFPLSIQSVALRAIFRKRDWGHIDLFEEISRGLWSSPLGELQWTKGQPLGLYPSFGSFTLTHGLLLLHLAGGDYHNQFFVVGDDVVILESKLRDDYISMLDRMSCPWSEDKSLSSSELAEFAGKVISPREVIPQLKWRKMSDDNFLDLCRLLGKKSRCLLTSRQKAVFDRVAHLCEPHGLNFSYPGSNLAEMIEKTELIFQVEDKVLATLMGLGRTLNHMVHESSESLDSCELQEITATFDEKVRQVMSQTVFSNWKSSISIGLDGLDSLPSALGLEPRLPGKSFQPTRLSTLERYERFLGNVAN